MNYRVQFLDGSVRIISEFLTDAHDTPGALAIIEGLDLASQRDSDAYFRRGRAQGSRAVEREDAIARHRPRA